MIINYNKRHFTIKEKERKFLNRLKHLSITTMQIKEYGIKIGLCFCFERHYFGLWHWHNIKQRTTIQCRVLYGVLQNLVGKLWLGFDSGEIKSINVPPPGLHEKLTNKKRIKEMTLPMYDVSFYLVYAKKGIFPVLRYEYKGLFESSTYFTSFKDAIRRFIYDFLYNKEKYLSHLENKKELNDM